MDRQGPPLDATYVALGSSYAAGLGPRLPGSPLVCQRSAYGYPQRLARRIGGAFTDMTCSGAKVTNVLRGGQAFLGPQIDAVGPAARLVTITAGGNDVSYVGDLTLMGLRDRRGVAGVLVGHAWKGPKPVNERAYDQLAKTLAATLSEIQRRAPKARVIVATYSIVLPPTGACARLGLSAEDAAIMRPVAAKLAQVTRDAALQARATLVDMETLSIGHDARSAEPWVNGEKPRTGAAFHPTAAGAQATANAIIKAIPPLRP